MDSFQVLIMVIGLLTLGTILFTFWQTRKTKGSNNYETQHDAPADYKPTIEFAGEGMNGYKGVVLGGKTFDDGAVEIHMRDLITGVEKILIPVYFGYNLIDMSGSERIFGKTRYLCNIDMNNRICEWLPEFTRHVKYDEIKEAKLKEKMKERVIKEIELAGQIKKASFVETSPMRDSQVYSD